MGRTNDEVGKCCNIKRHQRRGRGPGECMAQHGYGVYRSTYPFDSMMCGNASAIVQGEPASQDGEGIESGNGSSVMRAWPSASQLHDRLACTVLYFLTRPGVASGPAVALRLGKPFRRLQIIKRRLHWACRRIEHAWHPILPACVHPYLAAGKSG